MTVATGQHEQLGMPSKWTLLADQIQMGARAHKKNLLGQQRFHFSNVHVQGFLQSCMSFQGDYLTVDASCVHSIHSDTNLAHTQKVMHVRF